MIQLGVRVTMRGVVRHGRNIIPPVLLGAYAACRRLITPKLSVFWSLCYNQDTTPSSRYLHFNQDIIRSHGVAMHISHSLVLYSYNRRMANTIIAILAFVNYSQQDPRSPATASGAAFVRYISEYTLLLLLYWLPIGMTINRKLWLRLTHTGT